MKPNDKPPDWSGVETTAEFLNKCRAMLAIHGMLTDLESVRVGRRIMRWVNHHELAKLESKPATK